MTSVLVTGATGNVGTALLRRLAAEGLTVHGLARRVPPPEGSPARGVRWHAVDLTSRLAPSLLRDAMAGVDAVVNCAWRIQPSHDEPAMRAVNVDGTAAVLAAATEAGVGHLVHLSSVGAYAPGPVAADGTKEAVAESWPATGIPTSVYSRHKAAVERLLADAATRPGAPVVTVVRPGLVVQAEAGPEVARYFLGPFAPAGLLLRLAAALPALPLPGQVQVPVVHADDLADALYRVLRERLPGPLNVATEPAMDAHRLAAALGARRAVPLPLPVLRAAVAASWRLRLQPTDPGWVDIATQTPLLDTTRARTELGWSPSVAGPPAVADLLGGLATGRGGPTPVLRGRGATHGRMER